MDTNFNINNDQARIFISHIIQDAGDLKGRVVSTTWEILKPTVEKIAIFAISIGIGAGIGLIITFSTPGLILGSAAGYGLGRLINDFIFSIKRIKEQNSLIDSVAEDCEQILDGIHQGRLIVGEIEENAQIIQSTNNAVIIHLEEANDVVDECLITVGNVNEEMGSAKKITALMIDALQQIPANEQVKELQLGVNEIHNHLEIAQGGMKHIEQRLYKAQAKLEEAQEDAVTNQKNIHFLENNIHDLGNQLIVLQKKAVEHEKNVKHLQNQNKIDAITCIGGIAIGAGVGIPVTLINPTLGIVAGTVATAAGMKAIKGLRKHQKVHDMAVKPVFNEIMDGSFVLLSRSQEMTAKKPRLNDIKDESFILLARSRDSLV